MRKNKNNGGFSLIELISVIAIFGIMAAISWIMLANSKKDIDAEGACNQVASSINKARNYALAGRNSVAGMPIVISGIANANTYSITGTSTAETLTLPRGVTFASAFNCTFAVPSGVAGGCLMSIRFTGSTRKVTVDAYNAKCN